MYIDSFTAWLDTRAKYVLRADRVRSEITGLLQIIGMNNYDYNTSQFWMRLGDTSVELKDPSINLLDLLRRYHEYIDTHTLADFLQKHGSHEFLWGRPVAKVDTWQAADGVWLQIVFADNGECERINSSNPYIRRSGGRSEKVDFIGFYLDALATSYTGLATLHDFSKLILEDPFLSVALQVGVVDAEGGRVRELRRRGLDVALWHHSVNIWDWQHPVITYTYQYSISRSGSGKPLELKVSKFRND